MASHGKFQSTIYVKESMHFLNKVGYFSYYQAIIEKVYLSSTDIIYLRYFNHLWIITVKNNEIFYILSLFNKFMLYIFKSRTC
jgi:hypothetical protein